MNHSSVQLLTHVRLCDPIDCSTPGLLIHHQLLELVQTHVHHVGDAIQSFRPLVIPFSCLQSFPAWGSFTVNQFFPSSGQSVGASASASVLPMNIQGWFPLGWLVLSPCSAGDSPSVQARLLEWVAVPFSRGIFVTKASNPGLLHCRQPPRKPFKSSPAPQFESTI